jgi:hypothetical protein
MLTGYAVMQGLDWDVYTYGAMINAYSKAEMPPYLLDS